MKNSTKYKIINWVEKVLKYRHPMILPTREQTRKIQEVNWSGIIHERAMRNLKEVVTHEIAKEIMKADVVDYKKEIINPRKDEYQVYARVYFIEPIDRL